MGRKHRRADQDEPLTMTPRDVPRPKFKTPAQREREQQERETRDHERWIRDKERRRQEVDDRINWTSCLVPLCDAPTLNPARLPNESERRLPLCNLHLATAWRQVELHEGREGIAKSTERLAEERRERDERVRQRRLERQDGHIYYVRLNGLIKAGWSRDIEERLRAYGPDVEILCVHPGTRQDETTLHRNLRPFLARGREWYEDSQAMRDLVAKAVERHGQPAVRVRWTRPAEPPIRMRRR